MDKRRADDRVMITPEAKQALAFEVLYRHTNEKDFVSQLILDNCSDRSKREARHAAKTTVAKDWNPTDGGRLVVGATDEAAEGADGDDQPLTRAVPKKDTEDILVVANGVPHTSADGGTFFTRSPDMMMPAKDAHEILLQVGEMSVPVHVPDGKIASPFGLIDKHVDAPVEFKTADKYEFACEFVSAEDLLKQVDITKPIPEDKASQMLISIWKREGMSGRAIAAKLHRGKTAVNDWIKLHH